MRMTTTTTTMKCQTDGPSLKPTEARESWRKPSTPRHDLNASHPQMLAKIIFFGSVIAAILVVVLVTLLSPVPGESKSPVPWLSLSYSLHPPPISPNSSHPNLDLHDSTTTTTASAAADAFVFRHILTEGPEKSSRAVGEIRGLVIELLAFNIIHLEIYAGGGYSGTLSIEARSVGHGKAQELVVVGGTGAFAFARGHAILSQLPSAGRQRSDGDAEAALRLRLKLRFPRGSISVPG